MTRIDVMRHGEPVGGRRYRGHGVDDRLTETGWLQMWAAVPQPPPWQHIVSSPLARCRDFSQALSEKYDISLSIDEDMKEIGFGAWEGLTPDDIIAADKQALQRFYQDPVNNRPEGAEPLQDFSERVWQAYNGILQQHKDKHVLIVAHAGIARAVTANILGMELDNVYSRLRIEYGGIISSRIDGDKPATLVIGRL